MKKFEGMLFCTDLDGTLYRDDKTISRENLDAIEYFKSEGGLFTFITGRVPATSKEIYDAIKPNAPFGCFNGGAIFDAQSGKYLYSNFLSKDVNELVRCVDKEFGDMGIQYNTEKTVYFNKDNSAMQYFRKITGLPFVTCPYEEVREPILKVVFAHEDEKRIEELTNFLATLPKAENFDFVRSEKHLYEILPKAVSKGALVCKLAELLKIDMCKTVAVGDYNNDVSMIKAAGIGFAVENAVPEAKAVADYITVNNNENAIAAIIEGLDKGMYI